MDACNSRHLWTVSWSARQVAVPGPKSIGHILYRCIHLVFSIFLVWDYAGENLAPFLVCSTRSVSSLHFASLLFIISVRGPQWSLNCLAWFFHCPQTGWVFISCFEKYSDLRRTLFVMSCLWKLRKNGSPAFPSARLFDSLDLSVFEIFDSPKSDVISFDDVY